MSTPAPRAAFGAMVRRRLRREPVAYILGRKGFRRIELAVDRRVLIPRPETELLVEVALELGPRTLLDVGTGSGAIALAVADELPAARVTATDTSLDALAVAQANRERLGLADRVELAYGAVPGRRLRPAGREPAVRERGRVAGASARDPRVRAARGAGRGPTGLEAIEALLGELALAEPLPGAVALEVGAGQAPTVAELVRRAGYERVEARRDLAGIERVVVGWL